MIQQFFDYIIPTGGKYILVTIDSAGATKQYPYDNTYQMAMAATQYDASAGVDVYYAMASYAGGWYKDPMSGKSRLRTVENAKALQSIYADIDVDPSKPDCYDSKQEAWDDLHRYILAESLPMPLVVESANGFHVYWALDKPEAIESWAHYATGIKQHMLDNGVKIDPSATADAARILRPIGTHNKKNGGHFPVRCVTQVPAKVPIETFRKYWTSATATPARKLNTTLSSTAYDGLVTLSGRGAPAIKAMLMDDMPSATTVASGCVQLQVSGSMREPHWFAMISVLAKTKGGRDMAHYISSLDPRYNKHDVDNKFDAAEANNHAPPLCTTFDQHNPGGCEGCPNRINGTKTPLYQRADVEEETQLAAAVEMEVVPAFVHEALTGPDMWMYKVLVGGTDHGVYRKVEESNSKTGETAEEWEQVTDRVLVPIYKVRPVFDPASIGKNHSRLFWREVRPDGGIKDVEITSNVFANKAAYEAWLYDNSIKVSPFKHDALRMYMKSLWAGTNDYVPDLVEMERMGWTKEKDSINMDGTPRPGRNGFALGEQVLWPHSAPTVLQPTPDLASDLAKYGFAGTLKGWQEPLKILDNENQVWAQAILCMVLGSVVVEHMSARDGLPLIYVYSQGSGLAKSTAMRYAMSAWGDPTQQMVTGGSWTARINAMIRANSLPTLHDEMTQTNLKEMEDLLMSQSQGVEKERMAVTGGASRFSRRQWHSMAFSNGNLSFADSIAAYTTNEGPLLARIIEINLDHLPGYKTDVGVKRIFDKSNSNYGIAGRMMVQHILDNLGESKARLAEFHEEVTKAYGGQSLERMWMAAIAIMKFGCVVGGELGLHPFKWENITVEADRWIADMRAHLNKSTEKEASSFGDLMQFVYQGIIVSDFWGPKRPDGTRSNSAIINENSKPMARLDKEANTLTVPSSVMRRFVQQQGFEFNKSIDAWERSGRLIDKGKHARITTHAPMIKADLPPERCLVFDLSSGDDSDGISAEVASAIDSVYSDIVALTPSSAVYEK